MTGAFGYQGAPTETSLAVAELGLLPAVQGALEDAQIVTPGTSCCHQVRDGNGREAHHPTRILIDALRPQVLPMLRGRVNGSRDGRATGPAARAVEDGSSAQVAAK